MKKRAAFFIFLAIAVCLTGFTSAYFIYGRDLGNNFGIGENVMQIAEDYQPPKELGMGENIFKKRVQVKNTGSIPCFVRVFVEFSSSEIRDISQISPDGRSYFPAASYHLNLPEGWVYIDEDDELLGHYYYWTRALKAGDMTPPLFESVKTVIEKASQITDYEIIVYAESVQTLDKDGNEFESGNAWEEAWREFLERR